MYVITGRSDDVMNVSGHRLGSAEIESALVSHPKIAEAAVCSFPHPIKGEGIYAFATPMADAGIDGDVFDESLVAELVARVRAEIGPVASPDYIQLAPTLPKTRSGKIMRRILRKIASDDVDSGFGDTSTLLDPQIVDVLSSNRLNRK